MQLCLREIAAAIGIHQRNAERRAAREGWIVSSEDVSARRGPRRRLYAVDSLPEDIRDALITRTQQGDHLIERAKLRARVEESAAAARRDESAQVATVGCWQGAYIDSTLAVLRAFDAFRAGFDGSVDHARHEFAALYNRGGVEIAPEVRARIRSVSAPSLVRWQRKLKVDGLAGIRRQYKGRQAGIDGDPELYETIVGVLAAIPHTCSPRVWELLQARGLAERTNLRSVQRFIRCWKRENRALFTAVRSPDAWKSRYMSAQGSASEGITRLNQQWELDSTPADVMLIDGRHTIVGCIDVWSGRGKLHVSKTSRSASVATLFRRAIADWGVPEGIRTDNGADYTSRYITRAVADLDVHHHTCNPFSPWEKPHIERFFGTFSHGLLELMPDFIGHSVADRQQIRDRQSFAERMFKKSADPVEIRMTAADFQAYCDQWCDQVYAHQPRAGDQSPFAKAASWRHPVRRITDERRLDVLLAEPAGSDGFATVQSKGIRVDNAWYIGTDLHVLLDVGTRVQVRQSDDLGRLYVFDLDGRFITVAECPERTGIDRRETAIRARQAQKRELAEQKADLRRISKRARTDDIVQDILRDRAQRAGKLTALPQPTVEHDSAGLQAAGKAVEATGPQKVVSIAKVAETGVVVEALASDQDRFEFWKRLDARLKAAQPIESRYADFYEQFGRSRICRLMREAEEEFEAYMAKNNTGGAA